MVNLSADPLIADEQMRAILFYLTTFGHIDGEFDASEKHFIRDYVEKLVSHRVQAAGVNVAKRAELVRKYTKHFHDVFEQVDKDVQALFSEAVSHDEDQNTFVHARLKLRCFEIFQSFDRTAQEQLMESIDALLLSDGEAHPAELKFRAELSNLLEADLELEVLEELPRACMTVTAEQTLAASSAPAKLFAELEQHYSSDPDTIKRQIEVDRAIMRRALDALEAQRQNGRGKLGRAKDVREFAGKPQFLDGHVVVCPPKPGRSYDLTVLGDLHGCYSCLKAAVTQARFFEKLAAFKANPDRAPEPKLVLLGDYIDRGMFSINGVLRAVLSLYLQAPEHVVVLRGNHEYFLEYNGSVYGGVKPSEAIDTLKPHVSVDVFRDYMRLFDALPNMMLFERTLLVHGGIPRDATIKQTLKELSSLNDPDLRFQMMWSDPSSADVIPAALQEQSARFAFGRLQAQRFLQRLGCVALIRGHDKISEGFKVVYDDPSVLLCTLFSSGGEHNDDLPESSSYRKVKPMALTLAHKDGVTQLRPWRIAYEQFNDAGHNRFYESEAELAFVG